MRALNSLLAATVLLAGSALGAPQPYFRMAPGGGDATSPSVGVNDQAQRFSVQMDSDPPAAAYLNAPYQANASFSGGVAPVSYGLGGSIPPGLRMSGSTVTGNFAQAGTYTFDVIATDATGAVARRAYTVDVADPLSVPQVSMPGATTGSGYTGTLAATGGTGPYAWTVEGALPEGLSIVGNQVSGTPTAAARTATGLVFVVTDAVGRSQRSAPVDIAVSQGLAITTVSLPTGAVGQAYSASLTATGGVAPYRWDASRLPDGLTVSGSRLTGTVGAWAATQKVILYVTDATGKLISTTVTLPVTGSSPAAIRLYALVDALEAKGFRPRSNLNPTNPGRPLSGYFSRDDASGLVIAVGKGMLHGGWATFDPASDTTGILAGIIGSREIYWFQDFSQSPTGQVIDLSAMRGQYLMYVDRVNGYIFELII